MMHRIASQLCRAPQRVASMCATQSSPMTVATRLFASQTKDAFQDASLEGRYANALFQAAVKSNKLDAIFSDVSEIKQAMATSKEFKLFIETPGITGDVKTKTFEDMAKKFGFAPETVNFFRVVLENKRVTKLGRMIESFENYYRHEKGEVFCKVTSAKELSSSQRKEVEQALAKRAPADAKLKVEWAVQPSIMGGLLVKMGEAVLDYSIASRVERVQASLLEPAQ